MQKLRTERGITLIALIITIIVMLILVGVSVTVALNGGLFTTAKEATNKTQLELDKEQLLELALGAMNDKGKIDQDKLDQTVAADERFTGAGGTYTSVKSGKTYTVNNWGSVTEAPEYTLSGTWKFNDDGITNDYIIFPDVNIENPEEGVDHRVEHLIQSIQFTSPGLWLDYDGTGYTECENASYSEIKIVSVVQYGYEGGDTLQLRTRYDYIYYDDTAAYDGWQGWGQQDTGSDYATVKFGSTPQPVSKEFYDWFTANATQQS